MKPRFRLCWVSRSILLSAVERLGGLVGVLCTPMGELESKYYITFDDINAEPSTSIVLFLIQQRKSKRVKVLVEC